MEVELPNTHLGCCESPGQTLSPALPFPARVGLGLTLLRKRSADHQRREEQSAEGQPSCRRPPPTAHALTSRMGPLQ